METTLQTANNSACYLTTILCRQPASDRYFNRRSSSKHFFPSLLTKSQQCIHIICIGRQILLRREHECVVLATTKKKETDDVDVCRQKIERMNALFHDSKSQTTQYACLVFVFFIFCTPNNNKSPPLRVSRTFPELIIIMIIIPVSIFSYTNYRHSHNVDRTEPL